MVLVISVNPFDTESHIVDSENKCKAKFRQFGGF